MISLKLEVEEVADSKLPKIKIINMRSLSNDDVAVALEMHERVRVPVNPGDKVLLTLVGKDASGKDEVNGIYCGNATFYSVKEKNGKTVFLFSIGGLLLRIETGGSKGKEYSRLLKMSSEYFFCLQKTT